MPGRYLIVVLVWILDLFLIVGLAQAAPQIDKTFGLNGRVAVELGVKNSGHAVLVQPDGKIVVAGSSSKGNALNFSLLVSIKTVRSTTLLMEMVRLSLHFPSVTTKRWPLVCSQTGE